jgi:hypothetical protein
MRTEIPHSTLAQLSPDMRAKGHAIETIHADLSRPEETRRSINDAAALLGGIDLMQAAWGIADLHGVGLGPGRLDVQSGLFGRKVRGGRAHHVVSATLCRG